MSVRRRIRVMLAAAWVVAWPGVDGRAAEPAATLPHLAREEILVRETGAFTAYILKDHARTVVLDYPSMREQGLALGRVILFIERDGAPRNKVLSALEVGLWLAERGQRIDTLTIGNNFRAGELARFFNTVQQQGGRLSKEERLLYDWLLGAGILREANETTVPAEPEAVVISVPQASTVAGCRSCNITMAHRKAILEHEIAHARFATDDAYRDKVLDFWENHLSDEARDKFVRFLRQRGYDAQNPELMANEAQAFLLHTPDQAMFSARSLGMTEEELDALRRQFRTMEPTPFNRHYR
jgi:hypothetical protein